MLGIKDIEARMFGEHHTRCPVEKCLLNSKEHIELLKVSEQAYNKSRVVFWEK